MSETMSTDSYDDRQRRVADWIDQTNAENHKTETSDDVLDNIKDGDLILLENANEKLARPYETPRPMVYRLLVAKVMPPQLARANPVVAARDIPRFDRSDFIAYHHNPSHFISPSTDLPYHPLTSFVKTNTKIHLRPSHRLLKDTFYAGTCAYEHCNEGLITLSRSIAHSLGIPPGIRDIQGTYKSICPYCMSWDLFHAQESLQLFEVTDPQTHEASQDHLLEINWRRMQLGYKPLPFFMMPNLLPKLGKAKENKAVPNTHTRPVTWFVGHLGLDLGPRCPICKQNFQEEENVTMLHCGHIYHRKCIAACIGPKARGCPFGCDGFVRMDHQP